MVDLLKQMPYANNFALAVQDIRDEQAQKESEAIMVPELLSPTSPMYEPSSPAYTPMYEPMSPLQMQQPQPMMMQQQQQPMMMMPQQQMQPMMMMPQQQMMMVPQQQPMIPQQPMMTMQPTGPTSATGANAAVLIEEQLHPPTASESVSMLDVAPEVKPAETSSASSESGSSEGKRVIKLS